MFTVSSRVPAPETSSAAAAGTGNAAAMMRRYARPILEEAVQLYRTAEEAEPGRYRGELTRALDHLGASLRTLGRPEQALVVIGEAVELYRVLIKMDLRAYQRRLADALIVRSAVLLDLGRFEEARDVRQEADLYGRTS